MFLVYWQKAIAKPFWKEQYVKIILMINQCVTLKDKVCSRHLQNIAQSLGTRCNTICFNPWSSIYMVVVSQIAAILQSCMSGSCSTRCHVATPVRRRLTSVSFSHLFYQNPQSFSLSVWMCGKVARTLNPKWESLEFNSQCKSCIEVLANLSFHVTSVHPALLGTWWNDKNSIEMISYSCRQCTEFESPLKEMRLKEYVSIQRSVHCTACWTHMDIWTINMYIYTNMYTYITCSFTFCISFKTSCYYSQKDYCSDAKTILTTIMICKWVNKNWTSVVDIC